MKKRPRITFESSTYVRRLLAEHEALHELRKLLEQARRERARGADGGQSAALHQILNSRSEVQRDE
jgi:hypothetical protein